MGQGQPVVCVVGGANVDVEGQASGDLRAGDSTPGVVRRSPGGVGRNIAENLARLEVATRLITAVADDVDGTWLRRGAEAAGVDMTGTRVCRGATTATYVVVVDQHGEVAAAVNDMAVLDLLDPGWLDARRDAVTDADAVVVDANLRPEALAHLLGMDLPSLLVVDPVSTAKAVRLRPLLHRIHTVTPNRDELEVLVDHPVAAGREAIRAAAAELLQRGVQQVVVSLGADGLYFTGPDDDGFLARPGTRPVSVTGAGDALVAGLVWGQVRGLGLREAAEAGMAAAAVAASSSRTVSPEMGPGRLLGRGSRPAR